MQALGSACCSSPAASHKNGHKNCLSQSWTPLQYSMGCTGVDSAGSQVSHFFMTGKCRQAHSPLFPLCKGKARRKRPTPPPPPTHIHTQAEWQRSSSSSSMGAYQHHSKVLQGCGGRTRWHLHSCNHLYAVHRGASILHRIIPAHGGSHVSMFISMRCCADKVLTSGACLPVLACTDSCSQPVQDVTSSIRKTQVPRWAARGIGPGLRQCIYATQLLHDCLGQQRMAVALLHNTGSQE